MSSLSDKIVDRTIAKGAPAIIGLIISIIALIILYPWIVFWVAYFCGWIAKLVIGKYLVEGFALLGFTIPLGKIPLIAGLFGWIGGFFKAIYTSTKINN